MLKPKRRGLKPLAFIAFLLLEASCGWWIPAEGSLGLGPDRESSGPGADWDNPSRGFYQWRGLSVVPGKSGHGDSDRYQRFWWYDPDDPQGSLELPTSTASQPAYNFAALISEYRDLPEGGSFSFRIRSQYNYSPGTDLHPGPGKDKPRAYVPRYLLSAGFFSDTDGDGISDAFIPDWNAEDYLSAVERLLENLAATLDREVPGWEEKTGFVDFGLFGQYGEWYLAHRLDPQGIKYLSLPLERQKLFQGKTSTSRPYVDYDHPAAGDILPLTAFRNEPDNPRRRLLDAHLKAFSGVRMVMFFLYEQAEALEYLFYHQKLSNIPVGIRIDALGHPGFLYRQWENSDAKRAWWDGTRWAGEGPAAVQAKAFRNRWKTAPFISEFYGSTSVLGGGDDSALDQIFRYHISQISNGNFSGASGSAPVQWQSLSPEKRGYLYLLGNKAGFRMEVVSGALRQPVGTAETWILDLRVKNIGTAPLYGSLEIGAFLSSGSTRITMQLPLEAGENLGRLDPGEEGFWSLQPSFETQPGPGVWNVGLEFRSKERIWRPAAWASDLGLTDQGVVDLGELVVP